jgi:hypothetical protein
MTSKQVNNEKSHPWIAARRAVGALTPYYTPQRSLMRHHPHSDLLVSRFSR